MNRVMQLWQKARQMPASRLKMLVPQKLKSMTKQIPQRENSFSPDRQHQRAGEAKGAPGLEELLMCPYCRGKLVLGDSVSCDSCRVQFPLEAGVPIITDSPGACIQRNSFSFKRTNPYSPEAIQIIETHRTGRVLDFGAGFPPDDNLFDHVVRLDIIYYPTTTVVSNTPTVPFRDGSFDAIVSESVLEHLADPFCFAQECHRLLKPGGVLRVDTAFLQPYHNDPDHFFNMSVSGIRRVFADFLEIETGVATYQRASYSVNLLLAGYARCVPDKTVKRRIDELLAMNLAQFDDGIPPNYHRALAAGVFFQGRKRL